MTCPNCHAPVETAFCPACGQKQDLHRITLGHIAHEGFHSITHADKGFLLLVKELITRPGYVASEYIAGKRKRYFNPLSFLVITSALLAYFGTITGFMDKLTSASNRSGGRNMPAQWQEVFQIASHNGKWLTLLLIAPLFAFLSWLFFRKMKYNYAENFILHSFVVGEATLLRLLVFVPLYLLFPEKTGTFNLVFYETTFLFFLVVAYQQFFREHIAWTILKVILIRVLFIILFWGLIFGYVVIKHLII